jgi:glucokinase
VSDLSLVFDVGGHGARAALFDSHTAMLVRQADIPVGEISASDDLQATLGGLLNRAAAALGDVAVRHVVIAAPGPVTAGRVDRLPTLFPGRNGGVDLVLIGRRLWPGAAIWACNDLTAAGYGFIAQGYRDFCVLTCGSGIGAKLFLDGRPLLGGRGMGGEIGHWQVPGAPPLRCDCGGIGHLGTIGSGRGAVRLAHHYAAQNPRGFAGSSLASAVDAAAQVDSQLLVAGFRGGDAWTVGVIDAAAAAIGSALALVHLATGIERFFVTGGFACALGHEFGQRIGHHAAAMAWDSGTDWSCAVEVMPPDTECGLLGAGQMPNLVAPDWQPEPVCA